LNLVGSYVHRFLKGLPLEVFTAINSISLERLCFFSADGTGISELGPRLKFFCSRWLTLKACYFGCFIE
jgi:hypothetical protein